MFSSGGNVGKMFGHEIQYTLTYFFKQTFCSSKIEFLNKLHKNHSLPGLPDPSNIKPIFGMKIYYLATLFLTEHE
jgi:hypothetical protein